jgi:ATP-dependent helicase HrpB
VKSGLPIDEALTPLREALARHTAAVLEAPPGAGKSTVVPLALLDEPWARGKRLMVLEPRRLAARAIARRMAQTLGESVGQTVGYRMRLETRVSAATRIEVVTEGVLTRMLQEDPALEGVAAVVFDEFHERSLQADLGLALALDARANVAPGLRLLVMSATLDGAAVAQLLGAAPVVSTPGRLHPVATRYVGHGAPLLPDAGAAREDSPERRVVQLTLRALREERGDILVFLPGAGEIRRVQEALTAATTGADAVVLPLFGELAAAEQDAALAPAAPGSRKVVLATNIAETSLTIPGVRVVVDSGLVRRARFDPASGMGRLKTERISRASAEQRQGRAGRLGPGVCYRAWSAGGQASLAAFTPPEILEADLAPLALELARWGARDADALRWLDPPPPAMLASARDLLARLGALAADGRMSAHGRELAELAVHPRLAHMLLRARALGELPVAAQLAALLSERDLLRGAAARDADIRTRLEMLDAGGRTPPGTDRGTLERTRRMARELERQLQRQGGAPPSGAGIGLLLAFAYPDRIGRRREAGAGRYTLANGRGAQFEGAQTLSRRELIVAVDLDDRERDARITLAAPLERGELMQHFGDRIHSIELIEWSSREQAVMARRRVLLDGLLLEDLPLPTVPAARAREALLAGVRELGIGALPWDAASRDLQARMLFARRTAGAAGASWPDVTDGALGDDPARWLGPWLEGITRRQQLARVPVGEALLALLTWEQRRDLDVWAPTHLTVPSGSRVRIDYRDASAPAVAVKLQEVFGLAVTPRLGPQQLPITFRLLSPAQRPVQVTRDLASFWRGAYAQVRKDLRGRYPKHHWPEDPLSAPPSRGVRRRH